MWYFGKVVNVTCGHNGKFTAEVAWGVGGDTTKEELDENKWAGPSAELLMGS